MTFSICVHETDADAAGEPADRFGVAVTTRLPAVGSLCPHVSEHGAIATQSMVNERLGEVGLDHVADGVAVDDALEALLNADDGRAERQVHGVDAEGTFAFSGPECHGWYGAREGENYTVAGNLLTGASVVEAVADAYESSDREEALAPRLIDALAAGQAEGGDKRELLTVQSAAVEVVTTGGEEAGGYGNDLRVDASDSPVRDLRETYRSATVEFARAAEAYERDR
ncbi:DUF1028 domain-containing protein [Halarchaeum nitratireducens]|uniref:DUF1028 domain-containing protein n=1 Tax=Halarchaeum nitratireducens TaxID=489913 RepID=A0A830G721_9EURY|nr:MULTISPECIES: DUF1028 domain-containing protein [Halarchaeum]MBP2251182.1 putative Ntn-hydrolase superfamily protein [Halarchaeum solikamskense]GGN06517.1 hypothetical protein GCM10009021_01870 [Halarchaeum nitratireducens]